MNWWPHLVADPTGGVHLFYAYENAIYHAVWQGDTWSTARDVLALPGAGDINYFQVLLDADGDFHLSWCEVAGVQQLYYSRAHLDASMSAQGWQNPIALPVYCSGYVHGLSLGAEGVIHLAAADGEYPVINVYYVRSSDDGESWSEPIPLSNAPSGFIAIEPYVLDDGHVLHMVWTEHNLTDLTDRTILYARSTDNGAGWSAPQEMARGRVSYPVLVQQGNQLHLVSDNSDPVGRVHRYSTDGGQSWTPFTPFAPITGLTGPPQVIIDSDGTLHLITAGNGYDVFGGQFYLRWNGVSWSEPERFDQGHPGELASATIRLGNQLHAAWVGPGKTTETYAIWYARRELPSAPLPARPLPTMPVTPTPAPSPIPTPGTTPTRIPTRVPATGTPLLEPPVVQVSPLTYLLAFFPVVLFLLAIIWVRAAKRRSR